MNASGTTLSGFKGFVFLGEAVLLGWLVATEGLSGLGLMAVCVLAAIALTVGVLTNWPRGAALVLIVASAMPRLAGTLSTLHVRPEHVAAGMVLVAVFLRMLSGGVPRWPKLKSFDYFLFGYVILNFVTSAFTSPQPSMTLRWAALNAIIVSPFFLMRFLLTDTKDATNAVQVLLWVGFAEALAGIICYASGAAFHTTFGISTEQYGSVPGVHGTQYEANIFGSYTACCAIMFLAFFLMRQSTRRSKYAWGLVFTLLAAFVSLARSALLALPVAAAYVIWVVYKSNRIQLRSVVRLGLVFAVFLLAISPFLFSTLVGRFTTLDMNNISSDSSSVTRLVQTAVGIEDVEAHPLLGTGTASFQLLFNWDDYMPGMAGDNPDQGGWLGNTPLRILHDTGVIGLSVFLLFVGSLALATRKAYKTAATEVRTALLALSGGLVLYAITFQATEATMLAFTWVHFGLLAALVSNERLRVADAAVSDALAIR